MPGLCDLDSFALKHFLIAVVDLLGQKDQLRNVRVPMLDAEKQEIIPVLKETYGLVDALREVAAQAFSKQVSSGTPPPVIPEERWDEYRRLRNFKLRHFAVSDTVIVWLPLDAGPGQVSGVYHAMVMLAGLVLMFLARRHPLRGAIDVGVASDSMEPCLYGPALNEALRLEHEVAGYPRVVVGPSMIDYLSSLASQHGGTLDDRHERDTAKLCLGFLARDGDGETTLDYLGPAIRNVHAEPGGVDVLALGRDARSFFESELRRWQVAGCSKLAGRYALALHYADSRLHGTGQQSGAGD